MPIDREGALCPFCGEPEIVSLLEVWSDHAFEVETCCEGMHDWIGHELANELDAVALLRAIGAEHVVGQRLRRVIDDGGGRLVLDWQPRLSPVALTVARAFVARHHAHCGAPPAWRFGIGAWNGHTLMAVAMVGNPVARAYAARGIVEVNRLCIRRDVPAALAWNVASQLYGWAAREASRRGHARIITYTRADESGTSLTAAGWTREAMVRGRSWHGGTRARSSRNAWIDKVRWSRELRAPRSAPPRAPVPWKVEAAAPQAA